MVSTRFVDRGAEQLARFGEAAVVDQRIKTTVL
jgi:hypothetical protein